MTRKWIDKLTRKWGWRGSMRQYFYGFGNKYWSNTMQVLSVYYLNERTSKLNAGSLVAVFG